MTIYRGATEIDTLARGTVTPDKVYRGTTEVWAAVTEPPFNGRKNNFAGIGDGVAVTPGNSGSGGDAFNTVETSGGSAVGRAGGCGIQVTVGNGYAYPEWTVPASTQGRVRFYLTTLPSLSAILRVINIRNGSTVVAQVRQETNGRFTFTTSNGGWLEQTSVAAGWSTRLRIEVQISAAAADCHLFVYEGESTTPLPVDAYSEPAPGTFDRVGFGYVAGGSVNSTEFLIEDVAWSPDGATEIGPET